jgi:hypothetical protein
MPQRRERGVRAVIKRWARKGRMPDAIVTFMSSTGLRAEAHPDPDGIQCPSSLHCLRHCGFKSEAEPCPA